MVKKYRMMRVPEESFKRFAEKKKKMEANVKKWTGKPAKIPMTKIVDIHSKHPVYLDDGQVVRLTKLRKVKKLDRY